MSFHRIHCWNMVIWMYVKLNDWLCCQHTVICKCSVQGLRYNLLTYLQVYHCPPKWVSSQALLVCLIVISYQLPMPTDKFKTKLITKRNHINWKMRSHPPPIPTPQSFELFWNFWVPRVAAMFICPHECCRVLPSCEIVSFVCSQNKLRLEKFVLIKGVIYH